MSKARYRPIGWLLFRYKAFMLKARHPSEAPIHPDFPYYKKYWLRRAQRELGMIPKHERKAHYRSFKNGYSRFYADNFMTCQSHEDYIYEPGSYMNNVIKFQKKMAIIETQTTRDAWYNFVYWGCAY